MAETPYTNVYLETVEEGTNEIQKPATSGNYQRTSMAVGKHEERVLENSKEPDTESRLAGQISGIFGTQEFCPEISDTTLKLLNRRIRDRTYGGVGGRGRNRPLLPDLFHACSVLRYGAAFVVDRHSQ